ncbi:RNA polymerase sigma factor [Tellurirhabdus rosea]|uniref:RNA polymerase sigma factor n=1 Tax=Tellurirhabdus rosea TaxID=2674997 RepID=UPI002258D4C7|nr:sigma-70 family RNA polymerase sigma factor [Tellurirhabdus rosea]
MTLTADIPALLTECQSGNRKSQERLYREFYGYAMGICLRYSYSREDAVEILNDSFLKVFTRAHQYRPEVPFKLWLRRILINSAVDYHRQQQKHRFHEDIGRADQLPTVEANALEQITHSELLDMIRQLSPAYRLVFNLYVIDGFSHEEIAAQLQISIGTSKSNLSRAREQLKSMLTRRDHATYGRTS